MNTTQRNSAPSALMLAATLMLTGCSKDRDAIALPQAPATAAPTEAAPGTKAGGSPASPAGAALVARSGVLTGTTLPARASNLTPQVSGMLLRVMVKEGDRVKKGQALVQLDASDFRLIIRQASAARHTARMQLAAVKTEWSRMQGLLRAKAIPVSQFDKVDAQFKVAQAGVAQAEVAVARARVALAKTTIRAPYAAVVTHKMLHEGAYATVMPPSPVVRVEELDRLEVHIKVPEGAMLRVKKGTPVGLRFRAIGKSIKGAIDRIIPSLSPQTRSFTAIVVLPNPNHELRPGMFVEVSLGGAKQ